jgi:predicted dehydrogenase
MTKKIATVAVIGAGDRGKDRYGAYILENQHRIQLRCVAEPNTTKREQISAAHHVDMDQQFPHWQDLLNTKPALDGVIIATSDAMHFEPVMDALDQGYHVLLEKPMSNNLAEVLAIGEAAKASKGKVLVCHVLRYTAFYSEIKRLLDTGAIGEIVSIQHNENIGYYHFAHSFVRGNWSNTLTSSPLILAKSCHDMDLLIWLTGKAPVSVSAYGSLSHFKADQAPIGAGTRCLVDCSIRRSCPYAPEKIYYPNLGRWPTSVVTHINTEEALTQALLDGPYGRCVYQCDNDVVDHMVAAIHFEGGVSATFNLSAFTKEVNRSLKIMGTKGELRANDLKSHISVHPFVGEVSHYYPEAKAGGHGGGDTGIMDDFTAILHGEPAQALTSAEQSVLSHVLCFAAERSRLEGRSVLVSELFD